ncbi:MAG TPA: trypsin-like peptidase domain-containing protein [Kofleriaceae bacterium]|nr:trypsin-like peptidase domain-containing protein [Kofleriaceae bacterium]
MRRFRLAAVMALACSCAGTTSNTPGGSRPPLTAKDIVKRSSPAIVRIEAGEGKIGTGFILDKAGIVATNLHVIAGESAIRIKLNDGSQYSVMQIAGLDPSRDLALLRIQPTRELPTLRLGDSDTMSAGDQVFAIGNPLGFDNSVTSGLISQVRAVCGRDDVATKHCEELTVLQISAAISPGSSGGPLFNQFGEVIGVTTAIILAGQNINLAVPGNYLRPLIAQHAAIAPDQFAKQTKAPDDDDGVKIVRRVPMHELTVFDGCSSDDIGEVVHQIGEAIESGAPLYNDGKHEACFRIYEGTAVKFEHDAPCPGVRTAFGDGLLRAGGLSTFKEKAWAMRDTFDGLIDVAKRWAEKHPDGAKPERTKPERKPRKSRP